MINKLIKGGLSPTTNNKKEVKEDHKLDGTNDIKYIKNDVQTETDDNKPQEKFTLYKFFNVDKYGSESFILPDNIKNDNIKNIYLFGFHNGFADKNFFVKKK